MYHPGMYPDAVTNVLHGYAEVDKHTDEEIEHIHEVKTASRRTKKKQPHWEDEDYENEDLFFHTLVHNNDDVDDKDSGVVENVSSLVGRGRFDNDMFEKLNNKLFHHDADTSNTNESKEKVSSHANLHLHDILEDEEFFALE